MANNSILAAFERMWQHIVFILNEKSDVHPHPYAGSETEGGAATSAVKDVNGNVIHSTYAKTTDVNSLSEEVATKAAVQFITWGADD